MARKNKTEDVEVKTRIEYTGNWNRKGGKPIYGKAICIVNIDKDDYVLQHDEIGEIINTHVRTDEKNIKMINDKNIDTGVITKPEKTLKEKIKQYLQTGLDNWM